MERRGEVMTMSDLCSRLLAAIDPEDIEDLVFQALTEHRTPLTSPDRHAR